MAADVSAAPPVNTAYTFTGREYDSESGFYYYRARYYDPGTGRFLQKDPHPGKMDSPISVVNPYVYAANSPAMYTDPSGKFIWFIIAAVAIGAAVGGTWAAIQGENVWAGIGWGALGGLVGAAGALGGIALGAALFPSLGIAVGTTGGAIAAGLGAGLASGTFNALRGGGWTGFAVGFTFGFIGGSIYGSGVTLPTGSEVLGPHEPPTTIPQPNPPAPPVPQPPSSQPFAPPTVAPGVLP